MDIKEIRLGPIKLANNVFMAPLAGFTCYPFRSLCYELGAGLCFTEMVSSQSLKYKNKITMGLLVTGRDEKIKAAQLLGADPEIMGEMAKSSYLRDFDIIDINMGCPVPQVFKRDEGSALMADLKKSARIIESCKRSGKIITVKTRIGLTEDTLNAAEFAKMCEDAGADLITIHGRSRNMMYQGRPYYNQIEQAKSVVNIPVIANGGIFSIEEAEHMMHNTGADGIMIARYGLENPLIFSELTKKKVTKSKYTILLEQIELTSQFYNEQFTLIYIKKIASYFMKKRKGTKKYKHLLHKSGNLAELKHIIEKIFT